MTKVVAGSNIHDIAALGSFVVASYTAWPSCSWCTLLAFTGVNPMKFFRAGDHFRLHQPPSAASIPLNVEAQTRRPGVPESIAAGVVRCHHRPERLCGPLPGNAGGNGRADRRHQPAGSGVDRHPGRHRISPPARAGGGATFAALIVLPAMGLPVTLVALLISVETADRYGPYRAERQRLHGGRHHHQPADEANRQSRDGQRRRSRIGSPLTLFKTKNGDYPFFYAPRKSRGCARRSPAAG